MTTPDFMVERKPGMQAQTRTLLLVLVCFLLGLGLGAYWYHRATNHPLPNVNATDHVLAESTKTVLKTLERPVEIRYYALLDPASTSDDLRAFAERVDQLLSRYEHGAGGKITVTRYTKRADAASASAAGVTAFNLDKGEPCFLGVDVACNDQRETMGQLSPEWEAALETDLTRAIARVTATRGRAALATESPDAAVVAEVRSLIPNLGSVSLAEGKRILREAAITEIKEAADETQRRVGEAQQRITEAQKSNSAAEQPAALAHLQQVQAQQSEKLKELAARAQARIQALEQLKSK
jgi:hypothetical protein